MNTAVAIDLQLSDPQRAKLAEIAEMPPDQSTRAIGGLAQAAMEDLAAGAIMLSPASVNRLRSSLPDVYDEEALVAAIEKGVRKYGDSQVVTYTIDPIYLSPLEDVAKSNGMNLADLVQNCMSQAFELGWFYEMNLDSRTLTLTVEQYNAIREKIGREQVFGKDVADFITTVEPVLLDDIIPPHPALHFRLGSPDSTPEIGGAHAPPEPERGIGISQSPATLVGTVTSANAIDGKTPEPGEPVNVPIGERNPDQIIVAKGESHTAEGWAERGLPMAVINSLNPERTEPIPVPVAEEEEASLFAEMS